MKKTILLALSATLLLLACDKQSERFPTVMIGMDGAEWSVIEDMIAKGELPNFRHFREQGAWGRLIINGPTTSPVVWTTYVTGQFGRHHGILSHVYPYQQGGNKRPVTSDLRRTPALWNIATHHGLKSMVAGYFVTHPAEEIDGVMISPFASTRVEGSVLPEDAIDFEAQLFSSLRSQVSRRTRNQQFFGFDYDPRWEDKPDAPFRASSEVVKARGLDNKIFKDEFVRRASRLLSERESALYVTYYRLPDFMSHSLWRYHDNSDYDDEPDPELQAHFGKTIRETYRYMDDILGEVLQRWEGKANIMVLSDHGFGSATGRFQGNQTHLTGNHRPLGIMMATGPDISAGEVRGMTIMEVAPTLAALSGLPVSDAWPGRVETTLLREDYFEDFPLETVRNFDYIGEAKRAASSDEEAAQRDLTTLRGLGYIEGGVELDTSEHIGEYDFFAIDPELLVRQVMQEAVYYLLNGNREGAAGIFDQLVTRRPELASLQLARIKGQCNDIALFLDYEIDLGPCMAFVEEKAKLIAD